MRRALAMFSNDIRLQVRYGLYVISAIMIVMGGLLLAALARGMVLPVTLLVPPFVVVNLVITTFYFMAALLLFEKGEGVLPAIVTTPARSVEYLLSKAISLAVLGTAETLLIAVFVFGAAAAPVRVVLASLLLGVLYGLIGFIVVVRFESINQFLMPSVPIVTILLAPLLAPLGLVSDAAMFWHPVQPAMLLMRNGSPLAAVAAVLWCALALWFARRQFIRFVVRA